MTEQYVFYPAVFTKEDANYLIKFPDLPEIVTFGDSFNDALLQSVDALGLALLNRPKTTYPCPTELTKVIEDYPNSIVQMMFVDLVAYEEKHPRNS